MGKNVGKYSDMAVSEEKENPQPVAITEVEGSMWWMIRGSNPGHPARLTPYYKVLQDAVRCYLVMRHCSDCNGYKALATGYNTK